MPAIPSEKEWLESMEKARQDAERSESVDLETALAPVHPLQQLQGPFEESISDSIRNVASDAPLNMKAQTRRDQILTAPNYERLCGRRWRQKAGERYHPLWKLVAQISFGLHLFSKGMAKSELDVLKILQLHVADFDGFIERTTEDFVLARNDIQERLRFLRLPLENREVFDSMLEDRRFRHTVIQNNERIEHVIQRSAQAMNDSLKDIIKGVAAVKALRFYFEELDKEWDDRTSIFDAIYDAMAGNVEGWRRELRRLQKKGYNLAMSLARLNWVVSEMQRLVGVASRKSVATQDSAARRKARHKSRAFKMLSDRGSARITSEKPLPRYPKGSNSFIPEVDSHIVPLNSEPATTPVAIESGSHSPEQSSNSIHKFPHKVTNQRKTSSDLSCFPPKSTAVLPYSTNTYSPENFAGEKSARTSQGLVTAPPRREPNASPGRRTSSFMIALKSIVQPTSTAALQGDFKIKSPRRSRLNPWDFSADSSVQEGKRPRSQPGKKDNPFRLFRSKSSYELNQATPESDFESREHQMTWSQGIDFHDTYTFTPTVDNAPQFPHLIFSADISDQRLGDVDLKDDVSIKTDDEDEPQLTALPSLSRPKDSLDEKIAFVADTSAEVASIYSAKSRRLKSVKEFIPPLPTGKNHGGPAHLPPTTGDEGHIIHQTRHWLGHKSSLFSLRAPRLEPESPSSPSAEHSSASDHRSKRPSSSRSSSLYRSALPQSPLFSALQSRIPSMIEEGTKPTDEPELVGAEGSRARLGLGINIEKYTRSENMYSPVSPYPPGVRDRVTEGPDPRTQSVLKTEKRTPSRTAPDTTTRRLISSKKILKSLIPSTSLPTKRLDTGNGYRPSGKKHPITGVTEVRGSPTGDPGDNRFLISEHGK